MFFVLNSTLLLALQEAGEAYNSLQIWCSCKKAGKLQYLYAAQESQDDGLNSLGKQMCHKVQMKQIRKLAAHFFVRTTILWNLTWNVKLAPHPGLSRCPKYNHKPTKKSKFLPGLVRRDGRVASWEGVKDAVQSALLTSSGQKGRPSRWSSHPLSLLLLPLFSHCKTQHGDFSPQNSSDTPNRLALSLSLSPSNSFSASLTPPWGQDVWVSERGSFAEGR